MKIELNYSQLVSLLCLVDSEILDIRKFLALDLGQSLEVCYSKNLLDYLELSTLLRTAMSSDK